MRTLTILAILAMVVALAAVTLIPTQVKSQIPAGARPPIQGMNVQLYNKYSIKE